MGEQSGDGESEEEAFVGMEKMMAKIAVEEDMDFWDSQSEIKGWLAFVRKHPGTICKEYDVPHGILPKGYNGVLIDVKVGGKKRVPDDKLYMAHADLRAKVARGNCVLELNKIQKGKVVDTKYLFLVFAIKKFSGGLGDEDDSTYAQSQWIHYFIKSMDTTKKVICTIKENGEAAHISSRILFGQSYFCIGSKNVHMLIRNKDDISMYKDGRFDFARRIAQSFFETYLENPKIEEMKRKSLVEFLQSNHYTAVAEMIQPENQHVVNLSHLKHPELRFICWTKPDLSEDFKGSNTLCAIPIHEAIELARKFGLQTVDYNILEIVKDPTKEIEEYLPQIRKEHGYEGKVLYFLDADNCTIGLIKKKTAWYILLRALREKVASFSSSQKSTTEDAKRASVRKRIGQIQKWLGFSDSFADGWIDVSIGFVEWVHKEQSQRSDIRAKFPVIFDEYLVANPLNKEKYEKLLDKFDGDESAS